MLRDMRLKAAVIRFKEAAKDQIGRVEIVNADRGTARYERILRDTLDRAILLARRARNFNETERDLIVDTLINDYNYGFRMREKDRQEQESIPVADQTAYNQRLLDIEERKKENIKRVTDKFMRWKRR